MDRSSVSNEKWVSVVTASPIPVKKAGISFIGRRFERMMKEIAAERPHLEHASLSQGWIQSLRPKQSGRGMTIFGYHFPLNNAASAAIANDKAAASLVMTLYNVPSVPHQVFISPATQFSSYAHREGTMPALMNFLSNCPKGLVLKPKNGSSGSKTFRVNSQLELEQAWLRLLQSNQDFVVCPFFSIEEEFRCIVLDGELQLCYRKQRAEVVGDGKRTLSQLQAEYERRTKSSLKVVQGKLDSSKVTRDTSTLSSFNYFSYEIYVLTIVMRYTVS